MNATTIDAIDVELAERDAATQRADDLARDLSAPPPFSTGRYSFQAHARNEDPRDA